MVDISHTEENDVHIVTVTGEVDASSSIHLDNALSEAIKSGKNIVADLEGLSYISSAGLGVFMSYLKDLDSNNLKLVLAGLNEKVLHVFEILGLDQLLTIKKDLNTAKEVINDL